MAAAVAVAAVVDVDVVAQKEKQLLDPFRSISLDIRNLRFRSLGESF